MSSARFSPMPGRVISSSTPAVLRLIFAPPARVSSLLWAEDIIAYRRANGPFRIPEELTEVPGIGEGILEGLIDYVTTGEENR